MTKKETDIQWTFGPCVVQMDGDDKMTAKCLSGRFICRGSVGGKCSWNSPNFAIPSNNETPDACQYKAGAIRDAVEMAGQ